MNSKILFCALVLITWNIKAQTSVMLLEPVNGAINVRLYPLFKWTRLSNFEGFYDLQISTKSDFSVIHYGHKTGANSLTPQCPLLPATQYFWRIGRVNGTETDWSSSFSLTSKDTVINLTLTPMLPPNNSEQINPVSFKWTKTIAGMYAIDLSKDKSFAIANVIPILTGSDPNFIYVPDPKKNILPKLEVNTIYYWRVKTVCPLGPWSEIYSFKVVESVATPPASPPAVPPQPAVRLGSTGTQQAFSYPNPAKNFVTITFQVDNPGLVKFEISNSQGMPIDRFSKSLSETGTHSFEWQPNGSRPGKYFCKIVTKEKIEIVKLMITQ